MLSWLTPSGFRARQAKQLKTAEIYGAVVTQARNPAFYAEAGVPDTPEGRFEVIVLHLYLLLERLRAAGEPGVEPSRMLIEHLVIDMDDQMREMGVGDLTVPKTVKRAARMLFARTEDYRAALAEPEDAALTAALGRAFPASAAIGATERMARYVRQAKVHLEATPSESLLAGGVTFPRPLLENKDEPT